jgi:hypothetical protein
MGDDVDRVRLVSSQFDDLKNSAHDIRNYARQINADLDGKILTALNNASTKGIAEQLEAINETIRAGFASVVEAIANIQPPSPPGPKMRGTIMSDYSIPDNTPDGRVTFNLAATDEEGAPITDPAVLASLSFEAASSDESAFSVALDADQPDPTKRVGGYHVGAPGQAAVTSNLKDADGNLIGTGTDGFTVTTGKVALGSVKAEFEGLTPIV